MGNLLQKQPVRPLILISISEIQLKCMFWLCQGENGWLSSHNISSVWKDPVMCLRQRALKRRVLLSPASNCSCLQHIRKVSVLKREEMGRKDCLFPPGSWERQEHLILKAENFAIKIKGWGSYFQQVPMSNTAPSSINTFSLWSDILFSISVIHTSA